MTPACLQDGLYQLLHAEDGEAALLQCPMGGSVAAKGVASDGLRSLSWTAHGPCSCRRPLSRVPLFTSNGSTRVCPGQHLSL